MARASKRITIADAAKSPIATPTPISTPLSTPTPSYICASALQIIDDFTELPLSDFGSSATLTTVAGAGLLPSVALPAHPLPEESTVLQLDFETQTPGIDSSLEPVDAICTSCPTVSTDGKIGNAASFDGTDGLVTSAQLPRYDFGDKDITWAMWFKSTYTGVENLLGSYCGYGHLGSKLQLSSGRLLFNIDTASYSPTTLTSIATNLANGQWHHVAAVRKASSRIMELYVDGTLDSTVTGSALGGQINCSRLAA